MELAYYDSRETARDTDMTDYPNQLVQEYGIKRDQAYNLNARAAPKLKVDPKTGKVATVPGLGRRTFYAAAFFASAVARRDERRPSIAGKQGA